MSVDMSRTIALIGLAGSGKSVTAAALGRRLRLPAVDLDEAVAAGAGCTVTEIFAREGEDGFRRREREALQTALDEGAPIVACGGGVVVDPASCDVLRRRCRVVWLEVGPEEAARRLGPEAESRPLLAGAAPATRLAAMLEARGALYQSLAELRVDTTGCEPDRVAAKIEAALRPPGFRPAAGVVAMLCVAALLSSCAPRLIRLPEFDSGTRIERFTDQRDLRVARGTLITADVSLRVDGAVDQRLPGAQAMLALGAPDRARLRVSSLFGTALDLGVRGDSVLAWVPSWRTGLRLGSARDSLGLDRAGGLAYRALTATWDPPAPALAAAVWNDSLLEVTWREGADSLRLAVLSDGRPAWLRVGDQGVAGVRIVYLAWADAAGLAWPSRIEIEEESRGVRVTLRTANLRFPPQADSTKLMVRMPADAGLLTLTALRSALERLGVL